MCTSAHAVITAHAHTHTHTQVVMSYTILHMESFYIYYTLTPGTTTVPVPLFTSWCRLPTASVIGWLL